MALYFSDTAPGLKDNKRNITGNLLINTSYLLGQAKQDKGKWLRDPHIQGPSEPWAQINDIETQKNTKFDISGISAVTGLFYTLYKPRNVIFIVGGIKMLQQLTDFYHNIENQSHFLP